MFLRSRKAEAIGAIGEKRVASILSGIPDSRLLTNVLIPHATGTSEIDAVLVTPKQIYVIEAKNYSAASSITGSLIRYEWTQTIKRKNGPPIKRKIYNPVRQNQAHLSHLIRFLQSKGLRVRDSDCHSVIVFNAGCTLKKIPPNTRAFTITKEPFLQSVIQRHMKARKDRFTNAEVKSIAGAHENKTHTTKAQKKRHVTRAKQAEKARLREREKQRKARKRRAKKNGLFRL